MRKLIVILAMCMMLFLVVTACNDTPEPPPPPVETAPPPVVETTPVPAPEPEIQEAVTLPAEIEPEEETTLLDAFLALIEPKDYYMDWTRKPKLEGILEDMADELAELAEDEFNEYISYLEEFVQSTEERHQTWRLGDRALRTITYADTEVNHFYKDGMTFVNFAGENVLHPVAQEDVKEKNIGIDYVGFIAISDFELVSTGTMDFNEKEVQFEEYQVSTKNMDTRTNRYVFLDGMLFASIQRTDIFTVNNFHVGINPSVFEPFEAMEIKDDYLDVARFWGK